jgi:hypothetical protein
VRQWQDNIAATIPKPSNSYRRGFVFWKINVAAVQQD